MSLEGQHRYIIWMYVLDGCQTEWKEQFNVTTYTLIIIFDIQHTGDPATALDAAHLFSCAHAISSILSASKPITGGGVA